MTGIRKKFPGFSPSRRYTVRTIGRRNSRTTRWGEALIHNIRQMLDLNRLTVVGNVSKIPTEAVKNESGHTYAIFTIAASHYYEKASREMSEKLEIQVFAWNGLAEWIAANVNRGDRLYVE